MSQRTDIIPSSISVRGLYPELHTEVVLFMPLLYDMTCQSTMSFVLTLTELYYIFFWI